MYTEGMRFNIGDRFTKKAGAGFVGEPLPLCLIPDLPENHTPEPCFLCNDEQCVEYPTLYVLDTDGNIEGEFYHCSECQMGPLPEC